MKKIEMTRRVPATAEAAFDLSQDYDRRLQWDPFLREAKLLGASKAAVGVVARCVSRLGIAMDTEYVAFRRPAVAAVKMTKGPKFLSHFSASWNFREVSDGETEIRFIYAFELRGLFPQKPFEALIAQIFSFEMRRRLHSLSRALARP